mmetsp:Transcript_2908/g.7628  ORF Transcript_2908/g.7628 Transcript_2908/m.7628 type:complete len:220 (-) Transcript_2908:178-837(-)
MRRTGRAGGLAGLAFALFFCLLLAAAGEVKGGVTWKYCKGDWEASISNVTVLPDPVRAGQEINVLIDGEIGTRQESLVSPLCPAATFFFAFVARALALPPPPLAAPFPSLRGRRLPTDAFLYLRCCGSDGMKGRVVEGGELDLKVIFHKIPVYKETDDLCDRLETCPANGAFTVDAKQKLPPFTLPGKYQLQITAKDTEKKSLVCMMIDLDIKGPASFF